MQQFASVSALGVVGRLSAGPRWIEARIGSKPSWQSAPPNKAKKKKKH